MLLTMKALTQDARAITYSCAHAIDMRHVTEGEASTGPSAPVC
jgi:acyl-CoA dehydrogenase